MVHKDGRTKSPNHTKKPRSFNPLQALECRHYRDRSEIVASIEIGSEWKAIAIIHPVAGISAEIMAKYICHLINDNLKRKNILHDALDALELCLLEADLTFSAEQAADVALKQIRRVCP